MRAAYYVDTASDFQRGSESDDDDDEEEDGGNPIVAKIHCCDIARGAF